MISQAELKEEILKKGGAVYEHKGPVGFAVDGKLIYGVGCVRIDIDTVCDISSDGSASCWCNGMNYTVSPGIIVSAAEAPLATQADIERTKEMLNGSIPSFIWQGEKS